MEASGTYVVIHYQARDLLVRTSLRQMEDLLRDAGFFRVHRSALVNLRAVREVRPLHHGDCTLALDDGTKVRLTRSRREEFEAILLGEGD